jgi:3-oxoacid CoA-transferase subunit A
LWLEDKVVYLTGDTHGQFERIGEFCLDADTTTKDTLIILGDAGINYFGDPYDLETKEELSQLPITLFCIYGNHEQRPENLETYEEAERFGGTVYWEPDFPNLLFAKDGEIYELSGRRCMVIGGAYSVDKYYRLANNDRWWSDEQPSDEIKELVEQRLEQENWKIDIILSHTCPYKHIPTEEFLPGIDQRTVDNDTEEWLGYIEDHLQYKRWFCGHYHTTKNSGKVRFLYEDYDELRC